MTGRTGTLRDHSRSMHELLKKSTSDDLSLKRINEKYKRNLDDLDVDEDGVDVNDLLDFVLVEKSIDLKRQMQKTLKNKFDRG